MVFKKQTRNGPVISNPEKMVSLIPRMTMFLTKNAIIIHTSNLGKNVYEKSAEVCFASKF